MMDRNSVVPGVKVPPNAWQWLLLSVQHLFAMFGATVLVPVLTGMSPAVALLSSGIGTLAFIAITQGKVPSYLGSSFAFINPILAVKALEADPASGVAPGSYLVASFLVGVVYAVVALVIARTGTRWLMKLLPPIVVGPVIMVIGLSLAATAVGMATNNPQGDYDLWYVLTGLTTLVITILASTFLRGFFRVIPVLIGIIGGYLFAAAIGLVNFTGVVEAPWIAWPSFTFPFVHYTPRLSATAILLIVPVAIVPIAEHIGHQLIVSKVVGRNLLEDPGLHRSMLGDGVATLLAALVGGPPNTTYGENIGVLAITRAFSIRIFIGAALLAIALGFCGKMAVLLSSIPSPVIGGVSILLFGIIASSGLRMLVDNKVDFSLSRNLIIASVILVLGIGGAAIRMGSAFTIEGMALASIVGVVLNQVLPGKEEGDFERMFG
jgi:uracil permease